MIFNLPWKALPLSALVAAGLFMSSPGGAYFPPNASANVDIDALGSVVSGSTIEFDVDATDSDVGDITVTVSGPNSAELVLTLTDCNSCDEEGNSESGDGSPGVDVIIDSDDMEFDDRMTFSLEVTCDPGDTLTITAEESAGSQNTDTARVECTGANITIIKDAPTATLSDEFDFEISGDSSCDESFTLDDNEEEGFGCDFNDETYTIIEAETAGWALTDIDCSDENISSSQIVIAVNSRSVAVTLEADDESIECTFTNEPDDIGEVATVTASAAPSSVVCSGSSFVTVVVKTASGQNVADGTAVSISTNIGQLSPTSATTSGGGVLTIFTASSNQGGTATITASAEGKMGTALITVDCATQPTPAPTATPLPPIIQPPSTGDAGLAA